MQIKMSNAPASAEDVSAFELPLRLSVQLADELKMLDAETDDDYRAFLGKIRTAHNTITSISMSIQRIYDNVVSDLLHSCEYMHEALESEHAALQGGTIPQERHTVSQSNMD